MEKESPSCEQRGNALEECEKVTDHELHNLEYIPVIADCHECGKHVEILPI